MYFIRTRFEARFIIYLLYDNNRVLWRSIWFRTHHSLRSILVRFIGPTRPELFYSIPLSSSKSYQNLLLSPYSNVQSKDVLPVSLCICLKEEDFYSLSLHCDHQINYSKFQKIYLFVIYWVSRVGGVWWHDAFELFGMLLLFIQVWPEKGVNLWFYDCYQINYYYHYIFGGSFFRRGNEYRNVTRTAQKFSGEYV